MTRKFTFNRMELSGSLGDLGTLLPIAIAMILVNGLSPVGLFFSISIFFIISGLFFGVTVPVQPMKVIGAYAIATNMAPTALLASGLLMGVCLLILGLTNAIELIRKITPKSTIRGVQLSTGALLISGGVKFIAGTSKFQILQNAAEPYLSIQTIGPIPMGILIGLMGAIATLLLLDNKKFPAGLVVVVGGLIFGVIFGTGSGLGLDSIGFHLPELLPFGLPGGADFTFALFALVLPQLPMTLGNAVLAFTDLSKEYFQDKAVKVSNRNVCISMALANFFSFCVGGMPLCHGAGGLAAHYRFGARTAGSNLMIGGILLVLAIVLGKDIVTLLNLLPLSVLGVLLIFAGAQLTLTIMDLDTRKDYFVATMILGITLASNLAVGFILGMVIARLLQWEKLSV